MHGLAHRNHSPQGHSSSELGIGQPLLDRMAALYGAHARLRRLFGAKVVPMLAPPWNRIGEDLTDASRKSGFVGLSTFKRRRAREAAPGVLQVNTHVDPVFWRGHGGLRDEAAMLDDLAALARETVARPSSTSASRSGFSRIISSMTLGSGVSSRNCSPSSRRTAPCASRGRRSSWPSRR